MRRTNEVCNLPVKLSEEELAVKAQELAESVAHEEEMREAFAAWKSTMDEAAKAKKAGIYLAHAETVRLGGIVETGVEDQDVPCIWLYSKTSAFLKRTDTGELVQVRDLREDEKQAVIGEEAVVQEPTEDDLMKWADAGGGTDKEGTVAEIRFPNGVVVSLDDREAAAREMETFIREMVR